MSPHYPFFAAEDYKFFISFENGDCDDYITEKFFRYAKEVSLHSEISGFSTNLVAAQI